MKMIAKDKMENCFEGDFMVKYTFDTPWTKDIIRSLETLGKLKYYESFPRPMFQLTCLDGIFVKGVQGAYECRVIYARGGYEGSEKLFEKRFEEIINSF